MKHRSNLPFYVFDTDGFIEPVLSVYTPSTHPVITSKGEVDMGEGGLKVRLRGDG